MDEYEIAELFRSRSGDGFPRIRFGSVDSIDQCVLMVIPDGEREPIPAVRCCHPARGSRVVLVVNDTIWLAVGVVGGDNRCPTQVDDVWITFSHDDPHERWPGTSWEQLRDRMLLASGKRNAGDAGGEEEHFHWLPLGDEPGLGYLSATTSLNHRDVNVAHQIHKEDNWYETGVTSQTCSYEAASMPPYLVVHMWRRIS